MAFHHYNDAWTVPVASSTDRLVLLAVVKHADRNGRCWPSQARLAEITRLTDRTIRAALKRLEASGYIIRARRGTVAGRSSDKFTLRLQAESASGCESAQAELASASKRKDVPPERGRDFRGNRSSNNPMPNKSYKGGQRDEVVLRDRLIDLLRESVDTGAVGIRDPQWLAQKLKQGACVEMIEHVALSVAMRGKKDKPANSIRSWSECEDYFQQCRAEDNGHRSIDDAKHWRALRDLGVRFYTSRRA